ncbi:MAG: outer membrane beta-barrel protein [Acidobacteria bacterium]|nr:outer membrane beta-barrel protein [Acidobacteriota bacterium]
MKRYGSLFALLMLLAAVPAVAQNRHIDLSANAVWVDTNSDGTFDAQNPNQPFNISFDGEVGYGASANFFFGNALSLEVAASSVRQGVDIPGRPRPAGGGDSNIRMMPLSAVLQWHFIPTGRIDPYIGAGAAYVLFDDIDDISEIDNSVQRINLKDDVGLAVNAGLGIMITPRFAITLDGKYVPLKSNARAVFVTGPDSETKVDINPVIVSAGLTFRF